MWYLCSGEGLAAGAVQAAEWDRRWGARQRVRRHPQWLLADRAAPRRGAPLQLRVVPADQAQCCQDGQGDPAPHPVPDSPESARAFKVQQTSEDSVQVKGLVESDEVK